jgi:2,3-bisphosphoglycerate-independent phosphoglycerate mutase
MNTKRLEEKVYLLILDGFGEGKDYEGNAITHAKTPHLDQLRKKYPTTLLQASGEAVGLREGTQGGSEVGHFTIGAGRVIFQTCEEINRSIQNKSFFEKKPFLEAIEKVKKNPEAALHLLGMISDQGIHAHLDHLFALLELAKKHKVKTIYIHAITDGRDVAEKTAIQFIEKIHQKIVELDMNRGSASEAKIATLVGRYYAMDRDNNYDRTQKAYDLLTLGKGIIETDPIFAIKNAYNRGIQSDYYLDPILLDKNGVINNEDSVIFWNFRTDRTRQLTFCFTGEEKIGFKPQKTVHPFFVCMGDYSKKAPVVFATPKVKNNLGSILEQHDSPQLRVAETEKYAHVTYFFNSQIEKPFRHEKRLLIDSPKIPSYADKPEMSAYQITEAIIQEMQKKDYALIVQNFANPDLVGHSGNFEASVKAVEVIDECIGKIIEAALAKGYHVILTADHGNVEYKIYEENGEPCPSHSKNPVICMLISKKYEKCKLRSGGLQDIAPTVLEILGIKKPPEMTGNSLLKI